MRIWPFLVLVGMLLTACSPRTGDTEGQDLQPGALRDPPSEIPLTVEGGTILVREGRFEAEHYTIQGGRVRLHFRTIGGPYTITIERYATGPQRLRADDTTEVGFVANEPGDLTMRIEETGATATLTIIGPTSR